MPTYLVTGGAGFIGSNIVRELLDRAQTVRVLDNLATGKLENLQDIQDRITFFEADIRDLNQIRPAFEGVDYVLHQAAIPSVPRSVQDPVLSTEANVNGTLHVLIAARDAGVKRVVMASSSSIYGANPELPKHEGMRPLPISPYAASKLANEAYCAAFHSVYGLETVCLPYFNVFGPNEWHKGGMRSVVNRKFPEVRDEGRITLFKSYHPGYADGGQERYFICVHDAVDATLWQVGGVFNVGVDYVMNWNTTEVGSTEIETTTNGPMLGTGFSLYF